MKLNKKEKLYSNEEIIHEAAKKVANEENESKKLYSENDIIKAAASKVAKEE